MDFLGVVVRTPEGISCTLKWGNWGQLKEYVYKVVGVIKRNKELWNLWS